MGMLEGKVAIVTGASSGIGKAAAMLFAREGAGIVLVARRRPELDAVASLISQEGGRAVAVAGDVQDEAVACRAAAAAVSEFGGLDIAFNNAGTLGELGPTTDVSPKGWRDTLEINLTSAFLWAKHQLPRMLERGAGSIIFTSTFVGHTVGFPGAAAYAASKAGLIGCLKGGARRPDRRAAADRRTPAGPRRTPEHAGGDADEQRGDEGLPRGGDEHQ